MLSAIAPTTASPASQPAMNTAPFTRARCVVSISTTATIGIGLKATPTANGSAPPIAAPKPTPGPTRQARSRRGESSAVPVAG